MQNTATPSRLPSTHGSCGADADPAAPRDAGGRYGRMAVLLHWLMAVAVLGQLALGLWMVNLPDEPCGLQAGMVIR